MFAEAQEQAEFTPEQLFVRELIYRQSDNIRKQAELSRDNDLINALLTFRQAGSLGYYGEAIGLDALKLFEEGYKDKRDGKSARIFGGTEADKICEYRYEQGRSCYIKR